MDKIRLPEKQHFNIDELCKRWECDHAVITDYIESGILRVAIRARYIKIPERSIIGYYTKDDFITSDKIFDPSGAYVDDHKHIGEVYEGLKSGTGKPHNLPEYLYLIEGAKYFIPNEWSHKGLSSEPVSSRFELFDGERIVVAGLGGEQEKFNVSSWVIPKEERDRFEDGHSIDKPLSTQKKQQKNSKELFHEDMPTELKIIIELWTDFYINGNKPEHQAHTPAAQEWLTEKKPSLKGDNVKKRIAVVSNPDKRKNKGIHEY